MYKPGEIVQASGIYETVGGREATLGKGDHSPPDHGRGYLDSGAPGQNDRTRALDQVVRGRSRILVLAHFWWCCHGPPGAIAMSGMLVRWTRAPRAAAR
jgi:hypothetical protein